MCHLADVWPPPSAIPLVHSQPGYECLIGKVQRLLADDEQALLLVFGGNPVVGKALQLLLSDIGYHTRYLPQISFDEPDMLDGVQLLLFVGGVGARPQGNSASLAESIREKVKVPILELVSFSRETQAEKENLVPWPCRIDELKRRIDAVLLNRYHPERRSESYG